MIRHKPIFILRRATLYYLSTLNIKPLKKKCFKNLKQKLYHLEMGPKKGLNIFFNRLGTYIPDILSHKGLKGCKKLKKNTLSEIEPKKSNVFINKGNLFP